MAGRGRPSDPALELTYDGDGRIRHVTPDLAPELRAITIGTLAELRRTRGDPTGAMGPRGVLYAGDVTPLDGHEGVFVWDSTSTLADDGGGSASKVGTVAVTGVSPGRWRRILASLPGRLLRTTYLTAVTSLPSIAGCTYYEVEGVGCGAGGGGCVANSSAGGGGGGGGAPGEWFGTIIPANWAVAYGTPGTGGTAAGSDGGTGGSSTFSDGTNVLTLPGGTGGKGDLGGSTANMSAGGGPSAAAANSKFAGTGAPGDDAKKANLASKVVAGSGGSSRYGGGGKGGSNVSQDGPAGTGFGSGGAGGSDIATTSAHAGGAGAPALFILREYS